MSKATIVDVPICSFRILKVAEGLRSLRTGLFHNLITSKVPRLTCKVHFENPPIIIKEAIAGSPCTLTIQKVIPQICGMSE